MAWDRDGGCRRCRAGSSSGRGCGGRGRGWRSIRNRAMRWKPQRRLAKSKSWHKGRRRRRSEARYWAWLMVRTRSVPFLGCNFGGAHYLSRGLSQLHTLGTLRRDPDLNFQFGSLAEGCRWRMWWSAGYRVPWPENVSLRRLPFPSILGVHTSAIRRARRKAYGTPVDLASRIPQDGSRG